MPDSGRVHDLVVVGGGPAGLAVAIGAARAGLDAVVLERRDGVVDKACGEGLMPQALRALHALDVDPPGHAIAGITYRQGSSAVHADFRTGPGRGVRRTVLHDAMRAAAHDAGVDLRVQRMRHVEHDGELVRVDALRTRYLVGADGLHSQVRTAVTSPRDGFLALPRRNRAPRFGLRRHYRLAPWTSRVEVTWGSSGEAYVTPVGEDTIGVAILSDERLGFTAALADFGELSARLAAAEPVSAVRGAGPLRQRVPARSRGRVLLAGDAAGYVDALTGEGLALSFTTAAALVRCLSDDRPDHYDKQWRALSRRSRWVTSTLLAARTTPLVGRHIVPVAARAPWLFAAAVHELER